MRARRPIRAMLAMAPLAALATAAVAGDKVPPPGAALDQGFLEFLAEEAGLDEELSDALMTSELDREIARAAKRREVKSDVKNEE